MKKRITSVWEWQQIIDQYKLDTSYKLAHFLTDNMVGYRTNSLNRAGDQDMLAVALEAWASKEKHEVSQNR